MNVRDQLSYCLKEFFTVKGIINYAMDSDNQFISTFGPALCLASADSIADGIIYSKYCSGTSVSNDMIGLGVIEIKNTSLSPIEQLGQAYSLATNLVLSQLTLGLPLNLCAVPLLLSNGHLYQFAFVLLLFPSMPILHMTSSILDVSNKQNRLLIAESLERMKLFCLNQATAINELEIKNPLKSVEIKTVKYSLDVYHVKEISNVFSD